MQPTRIYSILTTSILSLSGRARVLSEYMVKRRVSDEDESVESFAVRRLGRECFERLVEPIVGGIFTARAETLSMQAAMPQFVAMEREHGGLIRGAMATRKKMGAAERSAREATGARYDQFLAPKKGMSWWLNTIANDLNSKVNFGHQVTALQRNEDMTWTVRTSNALQNSALSYNAVCLALPTPKSAALLKPTHCKLAALLDRIPYASSAVAVLAIKRSEISDHAFCFGVVIPKVENRDCLAISLASEKYAGRCPDDLVLARVFMGGAVRPELLEMSDEQLLAIARKEVQELLGPKSLPRWQSLIRWNEAMPQYQVGHTKLITSIRALTLEEPTLRLTGNAFDGVGIPQCIRLARQTADHFASLFSVPRSNGCTQ